MKDDSVPYAVFTEQGSSASTQNSPNAQDTSSHSFQKKKKEEEFMFTITDGTAKLLGRDHELRESYLRQEQLGRSEDLSGELQGEPEGFQPTE